MTDRSTAKDHVDTIYAKELSRLYDRIHRLEAQLSLEEQLSEHLTKERDRANQRAEYWAKMYDELTEIRNNELDDDDEIDPDND